MAAPAPFATIRRNLPPSHTWRGGLVRWLPSRADVFGALGEVIRYANPRTAISQQGGVWTVNSVECHQLVGQTLTTLAGGLRPFVAQVLNRELPPGTDWVDLLRARTRPMGAAAAITRAATWR